MSFTPTSKNNWTNADYLTAIETNKYGTDIRTLGTITDTLETSKANTSHTHSTTDLTSGTLPIARGGTGQTSLSNVTVGNATNATSANTATKLTTARAFKVNLASADSATFDGTANCVPGIKGILPTAYGGTGANALSSVNVGSATQLETERGFRTNLASTSIGYFDGTSSCSLGVKGVLPYGNGGTGSSTAPVSGGVAYGDGSAIKTTAAGTSGYILKANGTSAPAFVDPLGMTSICTYFCNTDDSVSIDFDDMATLYPNTVMFFDSRSGSAVYTNAPTKWLNSSASKGYLFNYTPTGDKSNTYMQIAYWCGTGGTTASSYPSIAMRFASSGTWTNWRYLKLYDSDPN